MLFFCADFPGNTDKLHGRSTGGGRVSRSVWSAWSLLPLSNRATHPTAGASSTHSIRFARFGSGYAGLGTDAPYQGCALWIESPFWKREPSPSDCYRCLLHSYGQVSKIYERNF